MKWVRRSLLVLLTLALVLAAGLAWMLGTQSGAAWVLRRADGFVAQPLGTEQVEGTLAGGLTLHGLHYGDSESPLEVRIARLSVDPVFSELLQRLVHVQKLEIHGLDVWVRPTKPPEPEPEPSSNFDLSAPIDMVLDSLVVRGARLHSGGETLVDIESLRLGGRWTDSGIRVGDLSGDFQAKVGDEKIAGSLRGGGTDTDAQLKGRFVMDQQAVRLSSLQLTRTPERVQINTLVELSGVNPQQQSEAASGEIRLVANVRVDQQPWTADLDVNWGPLRLPTEWVGQPLRSRGGQLTASGNTGAYTATGDFSLGPPDRIADLQLEVQGSPQQIQVQQARISQKAGRLTAKGTVKLQPALQWDVSAQAANFDPGAFMAAWPGDLNFDLATSGTRNAQGVQGELHLTDLHGKLRDRPLSGTADLRLTGKSVLDGELQLQSGNSRIEVTGQRGQTLAATAKLDVASLGDWVPDASGKVQGQVTVRGDWPALGAEGDLSASNVTMAGVHVDAADLTARVGDVRKADGEARLNFNGVTTEQLTVESGTLQVSGNMQKHTATLTTKGQPASLQMKVSGERTEGPDGTRWSETVQDLTLDLHELGKFALQEPSTLTISPTSLQLARFCLADPRSRVCALGSLNTESKAVDAQLTAKLPDIAVLTATMTQVANTKGSVDLQASVAGTLDAPQIVAQLHAVDLAADIPKLGLKLRNGGMEVRTQGENISIEGSMQSGDGTLRLDGTATRAGHVKLNIEGDKLLAADIPGARVIATPDLEFVRDDERMTLTGDVTIPSAQVNLQKLPRGATGVQAASPDVVIVDAKTQEEAAAEKMPLYANIDVLLGEDVSITGYGLQAQLDGQLAVREVPGEPTMGSGELQVAGKYQAYGQDLTITQGSILFASTPLDNPMLRISAVRKVDDVTAGLRIAGTAKAPQISVFSDPAMDEAGALSYLVAGRPLDSIGEGDGDALQSAARSLGTAAGGLLSKRLGKRLGIDTVGVEKNELIGGQAFTVGEYLSPRLYLSYGVGLFEPGDVVTLRYRLSDEVSLRVERGTEESRAGVEYRVER